MSVRGKISPADVLNLGRNGDGVGLAEKLVCAAKEHHSGKGDDEPGDADVGNPITLPRADEGANRQTKSHSSPRWDAPVPHRHGHDDAGKSGNRSHGKINMTGDDHQHHADGQHQYVSIAVEQIHQVGRCQHQAVGFDLKEGNQGEQGKEHAELSGISAEEVFEVVHCLSPFCVVLRILAHGVTQALFPTPADAVMRRISSS